MTNETMGTRAELTGRLPGEYTENFSFAYEEAEDQAVASLTYRGENGLIALKENESSQVIQFVHIREKESETTARLELIREGSRLSLVSTDVASGEVLRKIAVPPALHEPHDDHLFETIDECIAEFESSDLPALFQAAANRTCERQTAHVRCCLTDGLCWEVLIVFDPTSVRCRFVEHLPKHPELVYYKR